MRPFQAASVIAVFLLLANTGIMAQSSGPTILVGNTRGNNIVSLTTADMMMPNVTDFIADIDDPDHIVSYNGALYISSGKELNTSAIYKYDNDGELTVFASGGGLKRPYGFKFYNDVLYVASFLSDQILMYDAASGEYTGVFAAGNGTEEGFVNGPNHIDIHEGIMYLTTQGSTVMSGELVYMFNSQIVSLDVDTGVGTVFVPPPSVLEDSLGFVSLLGCTVFCDDVCSLLTTDFAGGLRKYDLEGNLLYAVSTTYAPGSSTGGLSIGDGSVYIPGFVNETEPGVLMEFNADDGSIAGDTMVVVKDEALVRPVGVFFMPSESSGSGPTVMTAFIAVTCLVFLNH